MEYWDLYDKHRQPTGETHRRGDKLPPNRYHTIIGVWTVHQSLRRILVTLRAPEKKICPNQWENTGGSIVSGEQSALGAAREVTEETGLSCSPSDLLLIAQLQTSYSFVDCYMRYYDGPADTIRLQAGETVDFRWVTLEELEALISQGRFATPEIAQYNACKPWLAFALDYSAADRCALPPIPQPPVLKQVP